MQPPSLAQTDTENDAAIQSTCTYELWERVYYNHYAWAGDKYGDNGSDKQIDGLFPCAALCQQPVLGIKRSFAIGGTQAEVFAVGLEFVGLLGVAEIDF